MTYKFPYSLEGVETNINKLWEEGTPHHPKSIEIAEAIGHLDYKYGGDSLGLSFGGDGDNGESLMYALDIYFRARENSRLEKSHARV